MNYEPILNKLSYWRNYCGTGDEYRKTHDLDCILTDGNLLADTIFSLWLPLRYTLNFFDSPQWIKWKEFEADVLKKERTSLKNHEPFLKDLESNIECFLPNHEITRQLIYLFYLGQKRCNIMILPYRSWNTKRGLFPYYDYLPHFLYDILNTDDTTAIVEWIRREELTMFFIDKIIDKEHIIDLDGTGNVCRHFPKQIILPTLLENYLHILEQREKLLLKDKS